MITLIFEPDFGRGAIITSEKADFFPHLSEANKVLTQIFTAAVYFRCVGLCQTEAIAYIFLLSDAAYFSHESYICVILLFSLW